MSFPSLTRRTLALLAVLEPLAALFIADMARTRYVWTSQRLIH